VVNLRQAGLDSISEHVGALAELRGAGLIRHLGRSNARAQQLPEAQAIAPVVCVQNRTGTAWTLDESTTNSPAPVATTESPSSASLARRLSARGGRRRHQRHRRGERPRAPGSPAPVHAWLLSRGPHALAIPGTRDPNHLAENIAAAAYASRPTT
jgi:aryl-alcohol dehydrogenase-like predicted oxidoreductase